MKPSIIISILWAVSLAVSAAEHEAWRWQQAFTVKEPGVVRLLLPPETLDASQTSLADLRLLSPDGEEAAYLLDQADRVSRRELVAKGFKTRIEGRNTVLESDGGNGAAIELIELKTPAVGFIKSVRVEASKAGGDWELIVPSEVIFREAGGSSRLHIPLEAEAWDKFRVTVEDDRSAPIPFTGILLTRTGEKPETLAQKVVLGDPLEMASSTRLRLDLGAKNLHLSELKLEVSDPVFRRDCKISYMIPSEQGEPAEKVIAHASIYRVVGEGDAVSQRLSIPIHARVPSRSLILTIENADSPALSVVNVAATRYPTSLVFYAKQAGVWSLLTGNPQAAAPRYDLGRLRGDLGKADGVKISPAGLTAKEDFKAAPQLPQVDAAGVEIDLTEWSYRRLIDVQTSGVLRVRADARLLAHSRQDLGDLRVIQNGRQVPYLVDPVRTPELLELGLVEAPDPKRPQVSRWRLSMPQEDLPATALVLKSSAPLFTRHFRVLAEGRDSLGNPWTRTIGSASWTKTSASDLAAFDINLGGYRVPESILLETDNGDNSAIAIDQVQLRFESPSLVFKLTDSAPVYVYYGNPKVAAPRYDLSLVRRELFAAGKESVALGEEETLGAGSKRRRVDVSAGSPWLWVALGLVVVVLLVVVAKLLPKEGVARSE